MIGINTPPDGFSPQDVLKEIQDVIRENAKAPEVKDRRIRVRARIEELTKAIDAAGIKADGTTLLAIVQMGEEARRIAEMEVEAQRVFKDFLRTVMGGDHEPAGD